MTVRFSLDGFTTTLAGAQETMRRGKKGAFSPGLMSKERKCDNELRKEGNTIETN